MHQPLASDGRGQLAVSGRSTRPERVTTRVTNRVPRTTVDGRAVVKEAIGF